MDKIKMQLFGTFLLTDGKIVLDEEAFHSKTLIKLLIYILMNRKTKLTHQKLIETFWGEDSKNPESALKNQVYLIRNALKAFGTENLICTLQGAYCWNSAVEVETDYEEFERMVGDLKAREMEEEEKIRLCRDIISCYKGNVTGKIAHEEWILPKVTWYQSIYIDTVKTMCELLAKKGEWKEIELICGQVLRVDSMDEDIHCWLMVSLHGQKKYDMALAYYEKVNKQFYENLGIRHPEKLRRAFDKLMTRNENSTSGLEDLLDEIREKDKPESVFFCDYQIFRQIYQMEARRIDRIGAAEHIALFTLKKRTSADSVFIEEMNILEEAIRTSLRTGDVASRYS